MIFIAYEADEVISFVVCSKTSWNLAMPPDGTTWRAIHADVNVTLRQERNDVDSTGSLSVKLARMTAAQ